MKKILFFVALLGIGATSAMAQTTPTEKGKRKPGTSMQHKQHKGHDRAHATPEQRAERATAAMTQELSLSAQQATQVQAIHLARFTQMQAWKQQNQGTADKEASKAQMKAAKQQYQTQLKAALTPEQYAKFEASMAEKQQRGQHRNRGAQTI